MGSVASELKAEREKRKISLAQIAADTRISLRHLESLEEGRYRDLPGGMYNRAFLKAYCESLNLDQREIIRRYEAEVLPLSDKPVKSKAHIPPQSSSLRLNPLILWSFMLLISVTGLFFSRKWITSIFSPYFSRTNVRSVRFTQQPQPSTAVPTGGEHAVSTISSPPQEVSAPPAPATLLPANPSSMPLKPPETKTQAAAIPAGKESSSSPAVSTQRLRLEIVATEQCWLSIDRDGSPVVRRTLEPGQVQTLSAAEQFYLIIGNAGGINMRINGKAAKHLGKQGEVIKLLINDKTLPDFIDRTSG